MRPAGNGLRRGRAAGSGVLGVRVISELSPGAQDLPPVELGIEAPRPSPGSRGEGVGVMWGGGCREAGTCEPVWVWNSGIRGSKMPYSASTTKSFWFLIFLDPEAPDRAPFPGVPAVS